MIIARILGCPVGGHEHVLGPAQADALGAVLVRRAGVLGRVGVRAHAAAGAARRPSCRTVRNSSVHSGADKRHVVGGDLAGGAVDRDPVALAQHGRVHPHLARGEVDLEARRRRDTHGRPMPRATSAAWLALPPSDVRMPRAAKNPATSAASVKGRTSTTSRPSSAAATASSAVNTISPLAAPGRGVDPAGEHGVLGVALERLVQERLEAPRRRSWQSASAPVEQTLLHGIHREAHRGLGGALGRARLKHVEAPLLHGELGVLHVAVVALERAQDLHQLARARRA